MRDANVWYSLKFLKLYEQYSYKNLAYVSYFISLLLSLIPIFICRKKLN